ncbi:hypothetical protein [Escherichia albertii]|uniref:hypothetical protein n=1 Tax=Escherichia albertii TaxID=208962 RepID=UPI0032B750A3
MTPEVDGSVKDMIQLGTVKKNSLGEEISLVFKATDPSGGECAALVSGKTASVAWSGNLTSDGIGAQSALAQDAYVVLKPVNGQDDAKITSADHVAIAIIGFILITKITVIDKFTQLFWFLYISYII